MASWKPKGVLQVHKNGRAKFEFDFQQLREADTTVGRALVAMETAAKKHRVDLDLSVYRPISDRMSRFGHRYVWMYDAGFPHWKLEISYKHDRIFLYEADGEFRVNGRTSERAAFGKAVRQGWSALDDWLRTTGRVA